MTVRKESTIHRYIGASTDSKPTSIPAGSTFYEYDTALLYITYDGTNYAVKPAGGSSSGESFQVFTSSAATTTTITAAALADVASQYIGQMVLPLQGAMAGEGRYITAYNGTNQLTVSPAWASDPDAAGAIKFAVVSGALGFIPATLAVPTANDSTNAYERDVIGNKTDTEVTAVGTTASIIAYIKGVLNQLVAFKRQAGVNQVFQKAITSAANTNGLVTIATVTTAACLIKSIVVKAVTAVQTDLTSAAVKGGASQAITFISAVTAAKANITAIDQQVGWTGAVELAAAKTIVMDVQGSGATAVNLLVTIEYEAAVDTGYLA